MIKNINREYLYINRLPFRIVNGDHKQVLNFIKKHILPFVDCFDILLVDEIHDKYYHYEYVDGDFKIINSVCLLEQDRKYHNLQRNMF